MKPEIKKQIILHLPYLAFIYLFGKVGQAFRLAQGADISAKLLHIGQGFSAAFASAAPSFHPTDLLIGLAAAVIIRLVVYSKQKNAKKYRKGMEYGTARWGTAADIKPFIDPVFDNNVLLTQTERLMMSNRPKDPKNARNKNILVIGGSGSGKTRFFCKPNIMQLHSSYVITDPKGSLICEVGQLLQRAKYRIAVLNTINFSKSMHYNPFAYLRTEKDILKLVNTIIVNTKGEGAQSTEDFWVKAERLYYTALIGYIHYEAPEEEKNFITLLDMINASDTREDDEDYKNPVDLLFDRLEEREPEHFAVKQYRKYKLAAGEARSGVFSHRNDIDDCSGSVVRQCVERSQFHDVCSQCAGVALLLYRPPGKSRNAPALRFPVLAPVHDIFRTDHHGVQPETVCGFFCCGLRSAGQSYGDRRHGTRHLQKGKGVAPPLFNGDSCRAGASANWRNGVSTI